MSSYKTLARRYRPQTFQEILGQDAIVRTLKNAIASGRIAHAYLFSGSRGTGKTTTARILAKALNCPNRGEDFEPCNACTTCREITSGHSLDVLEIDGASHRGIEDIRQINDTAGYTSSGKYKIYLIDEVHMLTKEAFNALLKTLEEPPTNVLFFFATTEPHKVLPTILSRCQRYHLSRIPLSTIESKLASIGADLGIPLEAAALRLIAKMAEGSLRDAESLLDQVIAFQEGAITESSAAEVLGVVSSDFLARLDKAVQEHNLSEAFAIADSLYSSGKNFHHFLETLVDHYRNLLVALLTAPSPSPYRPDHCQAILELLLDAEQKIRFSPSPQTYLEVLLLKIIRIPKRVPVDFLVKKLLELKETKTLSLSEDPVPTPEEIPPPRKAPPREKKAMPPPQQTLPKNEVPKKSQIQYDTLLQFAAVELEGNLERKK